MQKLILPFLGQELELSIAQDFKQKRLFEIEDALLDVIDHYHQAIGVGRVNSELERLNDADINYPVALSETLWKFVQANLDMAARSRGRISGFTVERRPAELAAVADWLELQPADRTYIRKQEVRLNAATLAAPYLIEQLEAALRKLNLHEFMIGYRNLYLARGQDSWEVALSQPDSNDDLRLEIQNEAVYFQMQNAVPALNTVPMHNPFQVPVEMPTYKAIIVEADAPLSAKLIASLAAEVTYEHLFDQFVRQWHCGITLLMDNGEIKQYSAIQS